MVSLVCHTNELDFFFKHSKYLIEQWAPAVDPRCIDKGPPIRCYYLNKVNSSIFVTFREYRLKIMNYIKWKARCSIVGLNLEFKHIQSFEFIS